MAERANRLAEMGDPLAGLTAGIAREVEAIRCPDVVRLVQCSRQTIRERR